MMAKRTRDGGDLFIVDNSEKAWKALRYLQDANFNVLGLIDSDGDLKERYEYTPYGQRRVFKNSGTNDHLCMAPLMESQRVVVSGPVTMPYGLCDVGHQGLLHDKEFGLIHNRARTLHPRLGRFLQRDPIGYEDGMSLYEYLQSAPAAWLDPQGLDTGKWKYSGDSGGRLYLGYQISRFLRADDPPEYVVWGQYLDYGGKKYFKYDECCYDFDEVIEWVREKAGEFDAHDFEEALKKIGKMACPKEGKMERFLRVAQNVARSDWDASDVRWLKRSVDERAPWLTGDDRTVARPIANAINEYIRRRWLGADDGVAMAVLHPWNPPSRSSRRPFPSGTVLDHVRSLPGEVLDRAGGLYAALGLGPVSGRPRHIGTWVKGAALTWAAARAAQLASGGRGLERQLGGMRLSEAKDHLARWDKGTYPTVAASIRDHAKRHGFASNIGKYLRKASNFRTKGLTPKRLGPATFRWVRKSGEFVIKRQGKIVSYGP